ncbi:hypothetical protein [Microcoleus sp. D2_18a_D3]|uniref:hypothetical protein n=1 Tax=Microcoleus sp. D2_18a_D3 TaxID=3055330 RepID=UPI002FCF2763
MNKFITVFGQVIGLVSCRGLSRLVTGSSGSLKGCRGASGTNYACCRSVPTAGRGLRFRRCGLMAGVSGVF